MFSSIIFIQVIKINKYCILLTNYIEISYNLAGIKTEIWSKNSNIRVGGKYGRDN